MLTERHIFERAMWNEEFCQNCGQQADAEIHQLRDAAIAQPTEDERVKEAQQDAVRLIDQLEGIEDLLSRGPWEASQPDPFPYKVTIGNYTFDCPVGSSQIRAEQSSVPSHCLIPSGIIHHDDAEGIAELRNLIPTLIATLLSLLPVQLAQDPFQARVRPWLLECFGEAIANDCQERNHRFLEESLELVQACGATRSEARQLVDYVYDRPAGKKEQETGGVMVTLAALCLAQGFDMHEAGEVELKRIWTKVDEIRAKQAAKPRNSPLPVQPAASTEAQNTYLDCAMCGASNSFVIDPRDPSTGYCFVEKQAWRITSKTCATKGCLQPKAVFGDYCMRCLEDHVNAETSQ